MVDKADDAFALWQQMVGEMQKGFGSFGDQFSRGSPDRTTAPSNSAQERLADLMESYFAGMNLPSRAQLNGISERLQAIENKLTEIAALLQEAVTNAKSAQGAPQPRQAALPTLQDVSQPLQDAPKLPQELRQPPQRPPSRPKRTSSAKSRPGSAGKEAAVSKDADEPE